MFLAACQQLVNSVGKEKVVDQLGNNTLIPVPSIDEEGKVKFLQLVVIKKKEQFFSTRQECERVFTVLFIESEAHHSLTDVLQDRSQISMKETDEVLVSDYGNTIKFSQKGKVGLDLFPNIKDVVDTDDTWTIQVKFGKVVMTEVDENELKEKLMERKFDLMHPFFELEQIKERNSLCLVTGVVHAAEESHTNTSENMDSKVLITLSKNPEINIENNQVLLGLDDNIALAYSIHELDVSLEDGSIKLKHKVIPKRFSEDFDRNWFNIPVILLLPETERAKFTTVIRNMMSVPRDIQIFIKLVEGLVDLVDTLELQETQDINLQDLEKQLLTHKQSWLYLLQLAGITVQESGDLRVSKQVTPLLKCFGVLFNDLSGLEDEELDLIRNCAAQTYSKVFNILHDSACLPKVLQEFHDATLLKDFTAKKFLEQLGYSMSEDKIRPTKDLDTLRKVYRVSIDK